jgi:hypothetical protein
MATNFQIARFSFFAMLVVGLIFTISMKVSPSGKEKSLLVVQQALWVKAPRVTFSSKGLALRTINKITRGLPLGPNSFPMGLP